LKVLIAHQVEFIVVGGVSAVLQGAPINTLDLDVVHARTDDNIARLLAALRELNAYYRGRGQQRLFPRKEWLAAPGHGLLATDAGSLDLLGTIGENQGYEELLPSTVCVEAAENLQVRVLDLATVIQLKEKAGREKDLAVLPVLRRTLEEKKKRS
jgi:hypothetical protein